MEKTVDELQAELDQANVEKDALQDRVNAIGANKIPTADSLKTKKKGIVLTREQKLRADLITARRMGKAAIIKIRKDLASALEQGLNPLEEMQESRFPDLRYLIAIEHEIRKHVKRGKRKMRTKDGSGTLMQDIKSGFRKGLAKKFKDFAQELIGLTGRKKSEWDEEIPVPGSDRLDIDG